MTPRQRKIVAALERLVQALESATVAARDAIALMREEAEGD